MFSKVVSTLVHQPICLLLSSSVSTQLNMSTNLFAARLRHRPSFLPLNIAAKFRGDKKDYRPMNAIIFNSRNQIKTTQR